MNEQESHQLASQIRTTTTRLIKKLRKKSETGSSLSLTERSVIALLDQHKQMLPSELAATEKITTQSMSQILNHLLELGCIIREASTTDKRKVYISLSPLGQEMLYRVRHEREEWLFKAITEVCTDEERELISRAMAPLTKIIDYE
ncbi:MarR family transcriptional regulator [Mucilaginibacter gynuensis]|uniref:MarR family transcriptional regulator n=1 Tax=Mucilaginibacter gynuensis TaxID=1302236 RepID=A0ABP8HBU4_9SPHI